MKTLLPCNLNGSVAMKKLIPIFIALTALPTLALAQANSSEDSDMLLEEVIVTA